MSALPLVEPCSMQQTTFARTTTSMEAIPLDALAAFKNRAWLAKGISVPKSWRKGRLRSIWTIARGLLLPRASINVHETIASCNRLKHTVQTIEEIFTFDQGDDG